MIKVAAMKTKRGSSPSGLDADAWRKKLSLNSYSYGNIDLRTVIASAIKKFAKINLQSAKRKKKHLWRHFWHLN